jgi:hypothetical protein
MKATLLDYRLIDNIKFDGIDHCDFPDYSDVVIISADYDGRPMTTDEIEDLDRDWVYQKLMDHIF